TAVVTEKPAFFRLTSMTRRLFASPSTRSRCCLATYRCLSKRFGARGMAEAAGNLGGDDPGRNGPLSTQCGWVQGDEAAPFVGERVRALQEDLWRNASRPFNRSSARRGSHQRSC